MPKRDQTPPYEIMRSRSSGSAGAAGPPSSAPGEAADDYDSNEAGGASVGPTRAPWWVGSSAPLVLRVPRGLAILAVAGLLLVIVVAYWVGSIRGAAAAAPDEVEQGLGVQAGPEGYYEAYEEDYQGPVEEVPNTVVEGEDRRVSGMYYIRLVETTDEAEARGIAEFFAGSGVAVQLTISNNGTFRVYVLDRPLTRDEYHDQDNGLRDEILRIMRGHGQRYRMHVGFGNDLSGMRYLQCVR